MKVINETKYDTRYLRSLFLKCEKYIFKTYLVHGENSRRRVTVKHTKSDRVRGYAWYHSASMVLKLPRPTATRYGHKYENHVNARSVARVYLHEIGHNIGLRHDQMGCISNIDVSWCPNEIIPQKTERPAKPKPNIIELRAAKAQAKLEEWTKKLNRAKTYVKKYQRKVKYYQKKTAASK